MQVTAGPAAVTVDGTLYGFGTPARVALPAAQEVVDGGAVASAQRAQAGLRDAAVAAETYSLENSGKRTDADRDAGTAGYLGMTPRLLRGIDGTLDPALRIVIVSAQDYCIELAVGSATAHAAGPPARVAPGRC